MEEIVTEKSDHVVPLLRVRRDLSAKDFSNLTFRPIQEKDLDKVRTLNVFIFIPPHILHSSFLNTHIPQRELFPVNYNDAFYQKLLSDEVFSILAFDGEQVIFSSN